MPLYEDRRNAENRISVSQEIADSLVLGPKNVLQTILSAIQQKSRQAGSAISVAFDGWYGVDWNAITDLLKETADKMDYAVDLRHANTVFKPLEWIEHYKTEFTTTDDPGFGVVNQNGLIGDLIDTDKIHEVLNYISALRSSGKNQTSVFVLYGPGAATPELGECYDLIFYFDKTRQPLLWQMWDGQLTPFGMYEPKTNYDWKEYYYCDFYLLHRQKDYAFKHMDFFIEANEFSSLKLLPRLAYDTIMASLVQYPIKEVKIFQPGPWGAYRYRDLWNIPGLECNAWNELAGPELSMLVDIGREEHLNLPFMNIMQQGQKFVGPYLHEHLPGMFPMDVWLDDGYFPQATPAERTSMPIHNHPGTDYVKRHFREPLGRYETYYIAEAYEGANTWMGFHDDVDLEEWEAKCRLSEETGEAISDWKEYIANHPGNVGDLFLIPPGTTHAHGGNQMVLEMDTCPSLAGTEYSFFAYDFVRPSWDDTSKTMSGKPVKMHLEHGFDNEKWRRSSWVQRHLLPEPKIIRWTRDYCMDRYSSYGPMPFEIERFHFCKCAKNDTELKFLHILTLTIGERVTIRSLANEQRQAEIELFQSAVVPACFGPYEIVNSSEGLCTVVQFRWKKG